MAGRKDKIIFIGESDELREVVRVASFGQISHHLDKKFAPTPKAQFAMELMMRGMIAGQETPRELVDRAIDISAMAFDAFASLGWLHRMTLAEEVTDIANVAQEMEESK